MKIITSSSDETQIKLSKKEWELIGEKAGLDKEAQHRAANPFDYEMSDQDDPEWITAQLKKFIVDPMEFWKNMEFQTGETLKDAVDQQNVLKSMLLQLKNVAPTLDMLSPEEQKHIAQAFVSLKKQAKEDQELLDRINQEDIAPEQEAVGVMEPQAEPQAVPQAEEAAAVEDMGMFATKQQISDIKDSFLDQLSKEEITEEQVKMRMKEFAKKYNQRIVLAISENKTIVADVEDVDGFKKEACDTCKSLVSVLEISQGTCEQCKDNAKDSLAKDLLKDQ